MSAPPAGDAYDVLGVPPFCDEDAIKRAFRALARKLHPDVNRHPSAQERFVRIRAAYEELSDPATRADVDARRRERTGAGPSVRAGPAGGGYTESGFWSAFGVHMFGRRPPPGVFSEVADLFSEAVESFAGGTYLHERTSNDPRDLFDGERFAGRLTGERLVEMDAVLTRAEAKRGIVIPFRFHLGPRLLREEIQIPAGVKKGDSLRYRVEAAPGIDLDLVVHVDIA